MNRDVCEHFNPVDLPCDKCKPANVQKSTLREAATQALEAWDQPHGINYIDFRPYMDALRAALAEPDDEPVAWLWQHRETGRPRMLMPNERTTTDDAAAWDVVGPLYLNPPQRKPLSGLEVERLLEQVIGSLPVARGLIRAVERAHGIKKNT